MTLQNNEIPESLPVLHKLEALYGNDIAFDYVSDIWGNDPDQMTPGEVIRLHEQQGWDDDGYSVRRNAQPGEPVLVDSTGNPILVMPREAR